MRSLRCPQCGGGLRPGSGQDTYHCPYCGTEYRCRMPLLRSPMERNFVVRGGILERYIGPDQEVLIPEGIVRIGERAFAGSGIESVRFPASVTYIAAYAFADCPLLTRLEFCSLPHMESRAFWHCFSLKEVKAPEGWHPKENVFLGTPYWTACYPDHI